MTEVKTSSEPIVMKGDFDYNLQQVLKKLVLSLQKAYDLSPSIIEEWLNTERFVEVFDKRNKECFLKVLEGDNELLNRLLDVTHVESFVDEYMPWEKEKCGHILEEFSNGYVQYCNKHRYLHQTNEKTNDIDHYFISKTPAEVLEEKIFNLNFNLYVDYTRLLVSTMIEEFEKEYKRLGYQTYIVEKDNFDQLVEWLKEHPTDFREKQPTYRNDQVCVRVHLKLKARQKLNFPATKLAP